MDSDEGYNYEFDEDEECSEDSGAEEDEEEDEPDDNLDLGEVELVEPGLRVGGERDGLLGGETGGLGPGGGGGGGGLGGGPGPGGGGGPEQEEDYRYEVLTAEQILQHMVECIREVNEVIQVRPPPLPAPGPRGGKRHGERRREARAANGPRRQRALPEGRRTRPPCGLNRPRQAQREPLAPSRGEKGGPRHPLPPGRPFGAGRELASCRGSVGKEAQGFKRAPRSLCGFQGTRVLLFSLSVLTLAGRGGGLSPCGSSGKPVGPWRALEFDERQSRHHSGFAAFSLPFPPHHIQTCSCSRS